MSPVCRWNPGGRDSAVCTLLDAGPCGPRLLRGKVGAGRFWIKLRLEALETIIDIDAIDDPISYCWICGKPVPLEVSKIDGYGGSLHA